MKKIKCFLTSIYTSVLLVLLPVTALAQGIAGGDVTGGDLGLLLRSIIGFTNTVLIPFIIGIGFLFFVWGMFRYFIAGGANEDMKESGKSLMIYATLGFVLIIVLWGIVNLLASSTGLADPFDTKYLPKAPGAT